MLFRSKRSCQKKKVPSVTPNTYCQKELLHQCHRCDMSRGHIRERCPKLKKIDTSERHVIKEVTSHKENFKNNFLKCTGPHVQGTRTQKFKFQNSKSSTEHKKSPRFKNSGHNTKSSNIRIQSKMDQFHSFNNENPTLNVDDLTVEQLDAVIKTEVTRIIERVTKRALNPIEVGQHLAVLQSLMETLEEGAFFARNMKDNLVLAYQQRLKLKERIDFEFKCMESWMKGTDEDGNPKKRKISERKPWQYMKVPEGTSKVKKPASSLDERDPRKYRFGRNGMNRSNWLPENFEFA